MPKLNPNEAPEGYVAVAAGPDNACLACDLCDLNDPMYCKAFMCSAGHRRDGCSVIFKRKPTKPIRKPREWMAWARVWKHVDQDTEDRPLICLSRKEAMDGLPFGAKVIRVKITEAKRG